MANTPTVKSGTPNIPTASDGQHRDSTPAVNSGQRSVRHNPNLGKEAVPPTRPGADTSTERKA